MVHVLTSRSNLSELSDIRMKINSQAKLSLRICRRDRLVAFHQHLASAWPIGRPAQGKGAEDERLYHSKAE